MDDWTKEQEENATNWANYLGGVVSRRSHDYLRDAICEIKRLRGDSQAESNLHQRIEGDNRNSNVDLRSTVARLRAELELCKTESAGWRRGYYDAP